MEKVTYQTRRESYRLALLNNREKDVVSVLEQHGPLTAREIAVQMWEDGVIPTPERNYAAPRLNMLEAMQVVKVTGKKRDRATGRTVAVYELV
jgi:hypothetical protein